jgi:glycosyltransferase involved in cell wall biosynthesis
LSELDSGGESPRRLRVAFVYDALYPYQRGGAERRYFEIAERLKERHDVHYVTWRHWDGPATLRHEGITFHGVGPPPNLYGADGKRTIREAATFASLLGPKLAKLRFDVIDCSATPYVPLYPCWAAARLKRTPMIATWHEFWGEHWISYLGHRPLIARLARRIEAWSVRCGDVRVAVSPFTAGRLPGRRQVTVVENGIGFRSLRQVPPLPPEGAADIVFVGRLIEDKRVEVLLEAMAMLTSAWPALRLHVIGDGPERPRLEALASGFGVDGNVDFLGHVDERRLAAELHAARIFALPSIREGFGISVIEAQACGAVPVVARAPHSAASSLIREGIDGVSVAPTAEAFAGAIAGLLLDPVRLESISQAAVRAAASRDWDAVASRMEIVYCQAIASVGILPARDARIYGGLRPPLDFWAADFVRPRRRQGEEPS